MSEGLHILVVDDDRRMAKTLVDIFRLKGHESEAAYSGSEALEKVERGCFNCVLSDIKMPEFNGVELCGTIKAMHPELPVVLMTAYSADTLVKKGLEKGALAVLAKPIQIEALFELLTEIHHQELGRVLGQPGRNMG